MTQNLVSRIKGFICAALLLINLIISGFVILLSSFIAWVIPLRIWRYYGMIFTFQLPNVWTALNHAILNISLHGKFDIQGNSKLSRKQWYLVISNHQSWLDIPLISLTFNWKIPLLKFFMKKELLWTLPVAGWTCYFLGYPFMKRHTRADIRKNPKLKNEDIETTRKACQKFAEFPTSVMAFAEGTRYSKEKSERQKSPYQYLLKPKAAGCAVVTNELKDKLSGILNITINYLAKDANKILTMWDILCGRVEKIQLRYELLPIHDDLMGNYYEDREFRARFQRWINERWAEKDQLLGQLKQDAKQHSNSHS
ncbi:MAG: acyltransferase [Gammaproteobacteria bacterium]|nr:acyltransferase [Gammaproteobacteria bacterium]MCH9743507.1 acyltransferase [Gammaproteobacteria bacterium]